MSAWLDFFGTQARESWPGESDAIHLTRTHEGTCDASAWKRGRRFGKRAGLEIPSFGDAFVSRQGPTNKTPPQVGPSRFETQKKIEISWRSLRFLVEGRVSSTCGRLVRFEA